MSAADLRREFGGRWDGGGREIHGLIERDGRRLKIELLRASKWRCSVFENGSCVATIADEQALTAVSLALASLER